METLRAIDVVVVGAGPAGLTAAMYLARYRRNVLVLHDGKSRVLRIPKSHNVPGFPDGVEGPVLIARMMDHAATYGARIEQAEVVAIARTETGFTLSSEAQSWDCRAVILASGVHLNQLDLPHAEHEAGIDAGVLRYCPICDGYEHIGNKVGVVGCDSNGAAEALFIRQFAEDITLMPLRHAELSAAQREQLKQAGIMVQNGALVAIEPKADGVDVLLEGQQAFRFDVVYPALGVRPRAKLAEQLGIPLLEGRMIDAAAVRDSGVPGFFAAGDVVEGLDQIAVAMGHGTLAATNAHNWLRDQDSHSLQARD